MRVANLLNCLQTKNKILTEEWDFIRNKTLTPEQVIAGSGKIVWWFCKKNKNHKWQASVNSRNRGSGCPYCAGQKVSEDNCLETLNPKLCKEWHPLKNFPITPKDVTTGTNRKVWWLCENRHEWQASIGSRSRNGHGCPYCAGQRATKENCLWKVNRKLSREFHPTKNGILTPKDFAGRSNKTVWWLCKNGHEWKSSIFLRNNKTGKDIYHHCPYCTNYKVNKENSLAFNRPNLIKEWYAEKNETLRPEDIYFRSKKIVWWKCGKNHNHIWKTRISHRSNGRGCPFCHHQNSKIEIELYLKLRNLFNNVSFRKKIFGKECDIFIPDIRFGIEVDGYFWHKEKYDKDKEKTNFFASKGIFLLRIRGIGLKKVRGSDIFYSKEKNTSSQLLKKILPKISKYSNYYNKNTQNETISSII